MGVSRAGAGREPIGSRLGGREGGQAGQGARHVSDV